ncbi:molybdenum cofactor sulfurase-like isoform X2 [Ostrea edulis]|uniref:molybdenum cofactor sulfurase-like isoform X2 n=1 Tax=Ostrea edulis TaxID=37623 RepID=UPI0024AEE363|nr:molybdenum cofactor sulfurase-like isoform X2 [Ostrea edulis]
MAFANLYNKEIEPRREYEFPHLKDCIYVEHIGATLYSKSQIAAYQQDLLSNLYGNPHSRSESSRLATDTVDQVRFRILEHFNTNQEEYTVIFTANCTAALKTIAECFNFSQPMNNIVTEKKDQSQVTLQPKNPQHGCFCYLLDNHTSVQGMRECVKDRVSAILCVQETDLYNKDIPKSQILCQKIPYRPGNCLFVFPAQSNFSGRKYPLSWVQEARSQTLGFQNQFLGDWYTVLDAAAFISTSPLDLAVHKPDFVTLSFYKMFGFPTGLGALLVKNSSAPLLKKTYFGGGTVSASSATEMFHILRSNLADRFEDGTIPFLDIIAVRHGLDALRKIGGGMERISGHTFCIAKYFHHKLSRLYHDSGVALAEIYSNGDFREPSSQGGVVNFNIRRANGNYIGFAEVDKLSQLYNIHLRTGCFCNIGACQMFLNISSEDIKTNLQAGHVCGDDMDLIDGQPTGSVRISFGYMSTIKDAQHCLRFIVENFLESVKVRPTLTEDWDQVEFEDEPEFPLSKQTDNRIRVGNNLERDINMDTNNKFLKSRTVRTFDKSIVTEGIHSCTEDARVLTNICLYPVKSCAAFMVSEWDIGPRGLVYDRDWMIVSDHGVAISQKREPKLCLIKPTIDLAQGTLTLNYRDMEALIIPLHREKEDGLCHSALSCTSKVCGDRVLGIDCGDHASEWISEALQRPGCRLIQQNDDCTRTSKLKDKQTEQTQKESLSWSNESQYLLITRPSIQDLHIKIKERQQSDKMGTAEEMDLENLVHRFRANLIVDGGTSYEEDDWEKLQIGQHTFTGQGGCSRCQMVCLDQETGQRGREPLRTLAVDRGRKIPFGIHVRNEGHVEGGQLRVGDKVRLL